MHAKRTYFAGKPAQGYLRARPRSHRGDPPGHWLVQERLTIHMHETLCSQEMRPHRQSRTFLVDRPPFR